MLGIAVIALEIRGEQSLRYIMTGVDVESTIALTRMTTANIVAALLLVAVTFTYVRHTRKMAKETAKMAKGTLEIAALNDRLWRHNVMPLFFCLKPELEFRPGTSSSIEIKNIGGIALLVQISISPFGSKRTYAILESGVRNDLPFGLPIQKELSQAFEKSIVITISFQDKAAGKYIQILNYELVENKWIFSFQESNLPKEITS